MSTKGEAEPQDREVESMWVGHDGATLLEERIFWSPVIARVRLSSVSSSVESGPTTRGTKYMALLEFSFSVLEYLKGSGPSNIVAVWDAAPLFDTRQEALDALSAIVAARDTQWDDREAIVFLKDSQTYLASTQQAGRYYLSAQAGHPPFRGDDRYSIASQYDKLWLPAESIGGASSYLLDVPSATGTASTIMLADLKVRIAAVAAKLNAGDGSEEYRECVWRSYFAERRERNHIAKYPSRGSKGANDPPPRHDFDSGLAAGSALYEDDHGLGLSVENRVDFWVDGGDADLFGVRFGDPVPHDSTGDGVNDGINFTRHVESARPLPGGTYKFHLNILGPSFKRCDGFTTRYEWTVTVTAPAGVLHEAFFDPVTVGAAVSADGSNGVLSPASFDNGGVSTTLESLGWESGTVKLKLDPHDGLEGQVLDFIEMDGTVSLSLEVADATVDSANKTLSWSVATQPWESGDQLMLRLYDGSAVSCSGQGPRQMQPAPLVNLGQLRLQEFGGSVGSAASRHACRLRRQRVSPN